MTPSPDPVQSPILLMVAGAKGAVASTLAVAVTSLRLNPSLILPTLTTSDKFSYLGSAQVIRMAGWDQSRESLLESIMSHGVLPDGIWKPYEPELVRIPILEGPDALSDLRSQIKHLIKDIRKFTNLFPHCRPVFINLLPAAAQKDLRACRTLSQLYSNLKPETFPDMAYTLAALQSGLPVVNFTSNEVEIPIVIQQAHKHQVPMCGRDGKTGQTYLKVVLASALKARNLVIDGWYSLNLLGNADGANLMEPERAEGKLKNKTELLDEIMGYAVGKQFSQDTHQVRIDYYPPRGDAKEAWDVIDFRGLFGLPMSLRINLQGRDSILAAPLVIDLARWMAAIRQTGRSGPIAELGFFFKRPLGNNPPLTFQNQVISLSALENACNRAHCMQPGSA